MRIQIKQTLRSMNKFSFQISRKLFLILYFWYKLKGVYSIFTLAIKTQRLCAREFMYNLLTPHEPHDPLWQWNITDIKPFLTTPHVVPSDPLWPPMKPKDLIRMFCHQSGPYNSYTCYNHDLNCPSPETMVINFPPHFGPLFQFQTPPNMTPCGLFPAPESLNNFPYPIWPHLTPSGPM